ncbi:MAG: c-type cytochrome [Pseudomonadota bacterium]
MQATTAFLLLVSAVNLAACGEPEKTAAPVPAMAQTQAGPPVEASPPRPGAAAPNVADLAHGQKIYRQACAFCHDKGVAGAPKTGDAAAWSSRIAQGVDTLHTVAVKGKGAMPAKGGNPALGEADVHAAVDFMIAQSR